MVKWDAAKTPEIIQTLRSETLAAGALHPDLIMWPESTTPFAVRGGDPSMRAFVEQLSEVNVEGVAPMTSVVEQKLKMRDDVVTDGDNADALMRNAPGGEDHFFVVKKVVE